jgi:multicomponent Na+:H+ antiporter subunit D
LVSNAAVVVLGLALVSQTADGTVLSQDVGGWPPGLAIVLAADLFSSLMVCVTGVLVIACLAFAWVSGEDREPWFGPLVLVLCAGTYGAYLTADLFNLFVLIEVMLVPSYVLLTLTGDSGRLAASRIYVPVSLLASTVLLTGIALVYGVTGAVNLGELAGSGARVPAAALAFAVVMLGLAYKAAVVPLHTWLPRTYPYAKPTVTALFSGLLTKVGVYALIRIYAVVFDGAPRFRLVILALAIVTMAIGGLGTVGARTMRSILSFSMVNQIGFALMGLGLFSIAGLAASIFFLLQYVLAKAAAFLCAGAVEHTYGTGRLDALGGLAARDPLLAVAFAIGAMSLGGVPPFSGFVAKYALIRAAVLDAQYLAAAVAVMAGLLTLVAMVMMWTSVFWARQPGQLPLGGGRPSTFASRLAIPALALAVWSVVFGVTAQPLLAMADRAAAGLVDTSAYVRAVSP